MAATALTTPTSEAAAPVSWEPCNEGRSGDFGAGCCDACGWPLDDHTPSDAARAA
ncbi:MAG TPA: hypothetical protein VIJ44_07460 [Acidimicrobiia bacterium]